MLSRKRILTKEEKEHLHRVFPTTTITGLCTTFHVGRERMMEILDEEDLSGKMRRGRRSVEPKSLEKCENCKSFSGRNGTIDGWCLKRKMRVMRRSVCSEHAYENRGTYVI